MTRSTSFVRSVDAHGFVAGVVCGDPKCDGRIHNAGNAADPRDDYCAFCGCRRTRAESASTGATP